jgi:hypothetical protein
MGFLWFSYGFPIKTSIFPWVSHGFRSRSWTPAIQSLCDVVWIRGAALRRACYALLSVWCRPRAVAGTDGERFLGDFYGKSMENP